MLSLLLLLHTCALITGCSGFLLNTSLSEVVSGRTMDSFIDLHTVVEVIPRGTIFHDVPPLQCRDYLNDCQDLQWQAKYGFVALNVFDFNLAVDGLNEKGLSVAFLWLDKTQYPVPDLAQ